MNSFRTIFPSFQSNFEIHHQNQILCVGSCFAEHMGNRLSELKFKTYLNPFGILYNPVAIKHFFELLRMERLFEEKDLVFHNGLWHSMLHHGDYSHPDKGIMLDQLNASLENARLFIKNCDRLLLTFGTATAYIFKQKNQIVANCHKIPNSEFEKTRIPPTAIFEALSKEFEYLKGQSPNLEIVLTVSPVRHIRDGFIENQRSKAALLLGAENLCKAHSFCHYFPAYEIVMDDLRDYRFFKEDLVHPNNMAVDYVWKYFEEAFFNSTSKKINQAIQKLNRAVAHRPLHPDSAAHRTFIAQQLVKIEEMESLYPFLDFRGEKDFFGELR